MMTMTSKVIQLERRALSERETLLNRTLVAVCEVTGVPAHQIKSTSRERSIVDARHAFIYMVKAEHGNFFSLSDIGNFILRDHATILHALRKSGDLLCTDRGYKELISRISKRLQVNNSLPMSKEEKYDAVRFLNIRIDELKKWLTEHPENPYREKVLCDLRQLENELAELDSEPTALNKAINQSNIS